jgi:Na+:H+ antiporter, NhaA family
VAPPPAPPHPTHRHPRSRRARARHVLTLETTSGVLLLVAAAAALVWANSPAQQAYLDLQELVVGPEALHLDLPLSTWAADGLLAVFFFVVGVELKHEFALGSLRDPRRAGAPVVAAVGGMIVPAVIFTAIVLIAGEPSALRGWAIPTATDIAFALAVLAVVGRGLPSGLRTFLLTLAVVDDLLAIVIIAVFYTAGVDLLALAGALAAVAVFAVLVRRIRPRWWILLPVAVVAWALMHESGVHATIAGVLLGFTVPARPRPGEHDSRTHLLEHAVRPWSTAVALPVFAFFSAGVSIGEGGGAASIVTEPVFAAAAVGLVAGKVIGVLGATAIVSRFTPLVLPSGVAMRDLLPVGLLTGIGFTVSLLISELSYPDAAHVGAAKLGVLAGSLAAAAFAAVLLAVDARRARRTGE